MSCKRCKDDAFPLHKAASNGHLDCFTYLAKKGFLISDVNKEASLPLHNACFFGHRDIVEYILSQPGALSLVNEKNAYSTTPLHSAAFSGFEDIVKILVQKGALIDVVDKDGASPLHKAAFNGRDKVVQVLLHLGADINKGDNEGASPIHLAAYNGKNDTLTVLLSHHSCNPHALDFSGATALHKASFNGHLSCATTLLYKGLPLDVLDGQRMSPLHLASFNGHTQLVEYYIRKGACVWRHDVNGGTPLHYSSYGGFTECIDLLLDNGANINARDIEGRSLPQYRSPNWISGGCTAIFGACYHGRRKSVQLLLNRGARLDLTGPCFLTPFHAATFHGGIDVVQLLLNQGMDINRKDQNGKTPLHSAVQGGIVDVVQFLLKKGALVNTADSSGVTALHLASSSSSLPRKIARNLLEHGANVNARDKEGCTPLHRACQFSVPRVVSRLLDEGADHSALDNNQATPLHYAAREGILVCVEELCNAGASLNSRDASGSTPLMDAATGGHGDIVKSLLVFGVLLGYGDKERDKLGRGVLHRAVIGGDLKCVRMVLKDVGDGSMNSGDKQGATPLHIACEKGHKDLVDYLLKHGADPLSRDFQGAYPLHYATLVNSSTCVKTMLRTKGLQIDCKDSDGRTPLHKACVLGHIKPATALISKGALIGPFDSQNRTPLHLAALNGHAALCKSLIDSGAAIRIADSLGQNALHLACQSGHKEVVSVLLSSSSPSNAVDNKGENPLHHAARGGNVDCAKMILESCGEKVVKSVVTMPSKEGFLPVHFSSTPEVAKYLLTVGEQYGLTINTPSNGQNNTLLHISSSEGNLSLVKFLLSKNANISSLNSKGDNVLHHTVRANEKSKPDFLSVVETLLRWGTSLQNLEGKGNEDGNEFIDQANSSGFTALHLAIENGNSSTVQLLIDHGADLDRPVPKTTSQPSQAFNLASSRTKTSSNSVLDISNLNLSPSNHANTPPSTTHNSPRHLSSQNTTLSSIRALGNPLLNPSSYPFTEPYETGRRLHKLLQVTLQFQPSELLRTTSSLASRKILALISSPVVASAALATLPTTEADWVSTALVDVAMALGEGMDLVRRVVDEEVRATSSPNTIFRGNSLATKVLTHYARAVGTPWLYATLRSSIVRLVVSKESYEIDTKNLQEGEDITKNVARLWEACRMFLVGILGSLNQCPLPIREMCTCVREAVINRFPGSQEHSIAAVGGILFLRFFVPSIVSPHQDLYDIRDATPSCRRALTLVSKTVQTLANFQEFKEAYMLPLEGFITENTKPVEDFLKEISTIPNHVNPPTSPINVGGNTSNTPKTTTTENGIVYKDPVQSINKLYNHFMNDGGKVLAWISEKEPKMSEDIVFACEEVGSNNLLQTNQTIPTPISTRAPPTALTLPLLPSGSGGGGIKKIV